MPTVTFNSTITGAGVTMTGAPATTAESVIGHEVTLPAAVLGTLSTRTDDDTGIVTVAAHTITTQMLANVFWSGGVRYGMTVTGADGTTVSVDGGAGDNFPSEDAVVYIAAQATINTDFLGTEVLALAVQSDLRAHADLRTSAASSLAMDLASNTPVTWYYGSGITNPITGDQIDTIVCSAGTAAATTLKVIVGYTTV